ncbi:MAG: outer membrane beta-barrel protein [gamma proteobacterium symbiont of Bathyaustriella thionipta]|nr:outer membrane beta-barrel protein [gamma proteobacterium symbiont of Bathyaustriella thionipta]
MEKRKNLLVISALAGSLSLVSAAWAEEGVVVTDGPGFYADMDVQLGYDDNVRRVHNNEKSSTFFKIRPALQMISAIGNDRYILNYEGDYALYDESNEDYDDHFFQGRAYFDVNRKLDLNFEAGYRMATDPRGRGRAIGLKTA